MQLKSNGEFAFKKQQGAAFAILLNTLSWYFIGYLMIGKIGSAFPESSIESLALNLVFPSSIIVSALAGSVFLAKIRRTRLFFAWVLLGIISSLSLGFFVGSSLPTMLVMVGIMGVFFGLGTPMCLSYFSESISIEHRGKVGGIILFGTILSAPLAYIIMSPLDLIMSGMLLAAWRAWSLPFLFLTSEKPQIRVSEEKLPSLASILQNRTFLLYFAAWLMFALVDSFEARVVNTTIGDFRFFIRVVEPAIAACSAIVAGLLSDWIGRKRVLLFGFASLGVAYATIGLLSQVWFSWLFYFAVDGIALGLLWVLFLIVLWGDMSERNSVKFYAVGEAPFFLTRIFSAVLAPYVVLIPETGAFSLAAFFLFIAVIPLIYVPETLPEKKLKDRELKMYVDRAMKIKEKHT